MIQPIKHLSVNWVDGMKISQKHFTAQENYFLDSLRDTASYDINQFNYGLLPIKDSVTDHITFDIYNSATNDVQLLIKHCHAITPAGYRIAINGFSININALPSFNENNLGSIADGQFYILISVNPFDHVPSGEFDPEETPPRHISTQPKYHVELVPVSTVSDERTGGNYIVAGRIIFTAGVVNADVNFIPPCTSIHSHPILLNYYNEFSKKIAGLQQFSIRIFQKNSFKNQNSVLADSIKMVSRVMLNQFAESYFYYRNNIHQLPPIFLINVFAKLAHTIFNALEILPPNEKEEMLNYCYEWSDVAPHLLMNQLSEVIEINYNHHKNGEYMKTVNNIMQSLYIIWEKLSGLDYIGQHKDNIVIKEEVISQVVKNKKGWNILD